jgi:hypothetical protein
MKRTKHIPFLSFLLAMLMLVSSALAQTTAETTEVDKYSPRSDEIFAARTAYTQNVKAEAISRDADDGLTLAQLSREGFSRDRPTRSSAPHHGYPQRGYQTPWRDHGHALIGAAIGFGLGAAIGAKANTSPYPGSTARAVVLIGSFGALIGGAIGAAHGGSYLFAHRRRTHPPSRAEDSESDLSADSIGPHFERRSTP